MKSNCCRSNRRRVSEASIDVNRWQLALAVSSSIMLSLLIIFGLVIYEIVVALRHKALKMPSSSEDLSERNVERCGEEGSVIGLLLP